MAAERLASKLKGFGLEKEEADIYVFLSASGPTPARVVARRFNLNRMKAYRSLKALEEKEFVQRVMGRPVKFIAAPLKIVIDRQLGGLRQTLTDLEVNQEAFIREWENLASGSEQRPEEPRFRIFQGRQQVFELLLEMYDRAHDTIRLVTTTSDLARLSLWGLDDKLKTLHRQGKKIRVLTQIDAENWKEVEPYSGFAETRHITLQTPIRFAIIDGEEALTTVAMDDSMSMTTNADTGLWTDAPSYVAGPRDILRCPLEPRPRCRVSHGVTQDWGADTRDQDVHDAGGVRLNLQRDDSKGEEIDRHHRQKRDDAPRSALHSRGSSGERHQCEAAHPNGRGDPTRGE